jgi:hypothetical protein
VVRGVTKSVIVVPSPDPALFESAIFIIKPGAVQSEAALKKRLLREAELIAGAYVREMTPRAGRIPAPAWAGIGAAAGALAACLVLLLR